MNFLAKRNIFKLSLVLNFFQNSDVKMFTNNKKPFTILVEGNIGCGKTTFLNNFKDSSNILALHEPIADWKNVSGYDLMKLFLNNPQTHAFTFQSYVLLTMMKAHEMETTRPIKMIERSIFSCRYIFVENLLAMKIMSHEEYSVIDEWFKWLVETKAITADLIIYLRTDPEVAYKRKNDRAKEGDESISLSYIEKLHQHYENWLYHKTSFYCPAPVLCLNGNKDMETVKNEYKSYQNKITI